MASLIFRMLAGFFKKPGRAPGPASPRPRRRLVDQGQLDGIRSRSCQVASACQAACCGKGASMPKAEAARIAGFVEAHPEYFRNLTRVAQPLVPLDTLGKSGLCQTEIVTPAGVGKEGLYRAMLAGEKVEPQDNAGSMCVFALADSRCSLQVAAAALGLHKWEYKPTVCWLFPLKSVMLEEKDGCRYYRLEHAGTSEHKLADYPCSRPAPDGLPAHVVFSEEIEHYRKTFIGEDAEDAPSGARAGND